MKRRDGGKVARKRAARPQQKGNGSPAVPGAGRRRLFVLLAALLAAAGLYAATGGWRARLQEETARSRQAVATVEQALGARQRDAAQQRALEAAIAARPDDVEARLELARLRWAAAGPGAAAAVLEPIGSRTSDGRVFRMLAGAQRLMGREDRALATLDRAVTVVSAPGDFQAERAMLFTLMGWSSQAREVLAQAEKQGADPLQTTLVRATMARQQGDLRTARRHLESARQRFPIAPEVVRQLAAIEEAEGRIQEALDLLASISGTEADVDLQVTRGKLYLRLPDPTSPIHARAAAMRALAMRPQYPPARALLGRCQRLRGELHEARATLERLHREAPHMADVAFELAQVYRDLDMTKEAAPLLTAYQQSLQRREAMQRATLEVMARPDSAQANLKMGRLCLDRGVIGRAILSLERAKRLDPRLKEVDALLARAQASPDRGGAGEE